MRGYDGKPLRQCRPAMSDSGHRSEASHLRWLKVVLSQQQVVCHFHETLIHLKEEAIARRQTWRYDTLQKVEDAMYLDVRGGGGGAGFPRR